MDNKIASSNANSQINSLFPTCYCNRRQGVQVLGNRIGEVLNLRPTDTKPAESDEGKESWIFQAQNEPGLNLQIRPRIAFSVHTELFDQDTDTQDNNDGDGDGPLLYK